MKNIAIVEEYESYRIGMSHLFCKAGFAVFQAANCDDLLQQLSKHPSQPDICLFNVKSISKKNDHIVSDLKERWPFLKIAVYGAKNAKALPKGIDWYFLINEGHTQIKDWLMNN